MLDYERDYDSKPSVLKTYLRVGDGTIARSFKEGTSIYNILETLKRDLILIQGTDDE